MTRTLDSVWGPHAGAPLVVAGAPAVAAEAAAVLVHGHGGTPDGMIRLLEASIPSGVTLLAPGARRSSWFPAPHDAPIERNEPAMTSALACVDAAVEAAGDVGVAPERTLLVGVSQGGCVVAERLGRRPRRFGGAVIVSAALPGVDPGQYINAEDEDTGDRSKPLAGTPVRMAASEDDPTVNVARVRTTACVLEGLGAAVETQIDPGSGHGFSDETIESVGRALDALL